MEIKNRITLYMVMIAALALLLVPYAYAQPGGPGGGMSGGMRGGGMSGGSSGGMRGGGDRRGNIEMGSGWGDRGRGGPRMDREDPTDSQINLILKEYSDRDPAEAKKLQEQREEMSREAFILTLMRYATPEYFQIMSDERNYTGLFNWCEKWVADEAKGIKELKEENYELYKKRLDTLENKYWSIIHPRIPIPEELIPVKVKDLQLENRQNELVFQIRTTENQEKKDALTVTLSDVVAQRYDLNIQQRTIQLQQIQKQIDDLRRNLEFEMSQIEISQDPNVADLAIQQRVDLLINPPGIFGPPRGGRSGRNRPPSQFNIPDINDRNSNPAP